MEQYVYNSNMGHICVYLSFNITCMYVVVFMVQQLSSLEGNSATRVQILNEAFCISQNAHTPGYESFYSPMCE